MNKCLGCGKTIDDNEEYCERCFQIKYYNNYAIKGNILNNEEIIDIVNQYKVFTFFLCDFLNLNKRVVDYYNKIKNNKLFVITKMDIIPKNVSINNFITNLKNIYGIKDPILISIKNDFGLKELSCLIDEKQEVLLVGPSSSGKSSLINKLYNKNLIVSNLQNTTPDFNPIVMGNIKIIDSPGLQVNNNLISKQAGYLRPIIINLKKDYSLIVNDYEFSFENDANLTLYLDKSASYKTIKKTINTNEIKINNKNEVVIDNIGFMYLKDGLTMYVNKLDNIEVRKSVISL